jgi:transcription initiation factor IIE alpha subunit
MFSRKPQMEPVPEVLTDVWTCPSEGCNSWMRNDFAFEEEPTCPECNSAMVKESRMLPQLVNEAKFYRM